MPLVLSRRRTVIVPEPEGIGFAITVGDNQPGNPSAGSYGYNSSLGSIDPDPPLYEGETIEIFTWNPVDFDGITGLWDIQFEASGLSQDFFTSVEIETSTGTISFNSAEADFFTGAFGGTRWRFEWDDVNRWGEADEDQQRTVTFS